MYLSIENDYYGRATFKQHDGTADSNALGALVDGFICTGGSIEGTNPHRALTLWCNDEGLLRDDLPTVAAIGATLRIDAPYPIRGNMVITCADMRSGDELPMDAAEVARCVLTVSGEYALPILNILPR